MKKFPKKNGLPKSPKRFSREAREWWRYCHSTWIIEGPQLLALESALDELDRLRRAQARMAADGEYVTDRFGQTRRHPAHDVVRDAHTGLVRALKLLALDIDPVHDRPGRPGGS